MLTFPAKLQVRWDGAPVHPSKVGDFRDEIFTALATQGIRLTGTFRECVVRVLPEEALDEPAYVDSTCVEIKWP